MFNPFIFRNLDLDEAGKSNDPFEQKAEEGGNVLKTIVELGSNLKEVIGQAFSRNTANSTLHKSLKSGVRRNPFQLCQICQNISAQSDHFCWAFSKGKPRNGFQHKKSLSTKKLHTNAQKEFLERILAM